MLKAFGAEHLRRLARQAEKQKLAVKPSGRLRVLCQCAGRPARSRGCKSPTMKE